MVVGLLKDNQMLLMNIVEKVGLLLKEKGMNLSTP
jgi:hypothetical protein